MLLKQAGCWQNHLRRISKSNMWVNLGSVQISWHNKTHTGSYQLQRFLCYTAPEQKGLMWRKEEMLSTHLRFCDSVMNTREAAWGWIQSFSAQSIGILYDNEKINRKSLKGSCFLSMERGWWNLMETLEEPAGNSMDFVFTAVLEMVLITEMDYSFCT